MQAIVQTRPNYHIYKHRSYKHGEKTLLQKILVN